MYNPNLAEVLVSEILMEKGIKTIFDLNMTNMMEKFSFCVHYAPVGTTYVGGKGKKIIIIDNRECHYQRNMQVLHEISHIIYDDLSYIYLLEEEWLDVEKKVELISTYVAMPYFLINEILQLGTVERVANYFCIPAELVEKRLEGINKRMKGEVKNASIQGQRAWNMVLSDKLYRH